MSVLRVVRAAAALGAVATVAFGAGPAAAATGSSRPVRAVMILLDVNQDAIGPATAAAERAAAVAYLDALPGDVQAGLITFNRSWTLVMRPTSGRQALAAAIRSAPESGLVSTGLTGALTGAQTALSALGPAADTRVLVLSDAEELTGATPASAVPTDVVAWRIESDDNVALLRSLAAATGGRLVGLANAATLAAAFPAVQPSLPPSAKATRPPASVTSVASALPASAPWHFSASLLAAVGALVLAIVGIVLLASGAASSGLRGRRIVGQVAQYGPTHAARKPAERPAPGRMADAALGLAERALKARGTDRTLAERLDLAGMTIRPAEFVVLGACVSVVAAAALTILTHTFLIGVPAGLVVGWLGMRLLVSVRIARRRAAFGELLPDVLQLIASSLQSGFSLAQALDAVVREGSQPTATEFSRALGEARIGADLADALENVAVRMDSQDMRWTVMAIRIQRSVGGNLAEVLRNTVATMRERGFLRRHVKALSAEGRLSAYILIALPIFVGGWLFYSAESYMQVLYSTVYGVVMLGSATVLVVIGALWMRAMIRVEV